MSHNTFEFLITTSKGLDGMLLEEIAEICPDVALKSKPGQVLFSGELADAYKVCIWSRLANRVLVKLAEGEVNSADDVYKITDQANWPTQFGVSDTFMVDFTGTNQSINNTQFGGLKVKDAIVDQFTTFFDERPSVSKISPNIRIQARMWRSILGIYIDLTGQSLHQRHYRTKTGLAPVKEHLASAMLIRSGWTKHTHTPLIDPMCGAGTIAIEAAMIASNMAPGLKRAAWGFDAWKGHNKSCWESLIIEAEQARQSHNSVIWANDIDGSMVSVAKENAHAAGVFDQIKFSQQDACGLPATDLPSGYMVSNPPYGERLSETTQLMPVFQKWGSWLKTEFKTWHLSLLTSDRNLLRQMKLAAKKEYKLMKINDNGIYIDGIDKKILRALMEDARTPILEIARNVGISGAAIHQRLKKLEKSGLIAGLGETVDEIREVMRDLRKVDCDILTIGQYLQPTLNHLPIERYVTPEQFEDYRQQGLALGFLEVVSGVFVRSSYRAEQVLQKNNVGLVG